MEEKQYACAVVIPALNPGKELPGYVRGLLDRGIPAVIVVPERLRPGIVATAWHSPISSASRMRMVRAVLFPWGMRSAA